VVEVRVVMNEREAVLGGAGGHEEVGGRYAQTL
jgi:hypothetical protein